MYMLEKLMHSHPIVSFPSFYSGEICSVWLQSQAPHANIRQQDNGRQRES